MFCYDLAEILYCVAVCVCVCLCLFYKVSCYAFCWLVGWLFGIWCSCAHKFTWNSHFKTNLTCARATTSLELWPEFHKHFIMVFLRCTINNSASVREKWHACAGAHKHKHQHQHIYMCLYFIRYSFSYICDERPPANVVQIFLHVLAYR